MKNKTVIIPIFLIIISLFALFRPAGRITFDKTVSENRILFQYEIFGCGSLVGKVLDGGGDISAQFKAEYPDIAANEVVFTQGSDEPKKHMDDGDFFTGGLAEKYTYIIEGEPVGVTRGAPDCCEPVPAYNEHAVEFEVNKWYFTEYVPYIEIGNTFVVLTALGLICISAVWLATLLIVGVWRKIRQKYCEGKL